MMATNMPEALDEALLRPGRIDRIYKVGYPSKAGRVRTYEGYLDKVPHELTDGGHRQARHDHPVRHRRHHQGPRQRGADHRDPGRPRGHHLARRDQGQAAQGARPARGRRVHRARAARRRRARGVPRGRRLPHPPAHGDRHRDDREGQRLPRHGREHPAGGPVHPVAHRVRGRHPRLARLAGRRADVLRGRQLVGRVRRPGVGDAGGVLHGGLLGHGPHRVVVLTARRLEVGSPGGGRGGPPKGETPRRSCARALADRIEDKLAELLDRAEEILRENRREVLAMAHALETHKTLTGEDVEAVVEGREGPPSTAACTATGVRRTAWRSTTRRRPARTAATRR